MTAAPRSSVAVVLLALVAACGSEPAPTAFTVAGVGLATPESVVHDPDADVYLVSNISGDPFAKDGDGFVSRIAPDGAVVALKWIDGAADGVELNAPKGLALTADHLWVADIDTVRRFDRRTGAPAGAVTIDGATFLNDVTVTADGTVYVTDSGLAPGFTPSGTDAVWRIDGELNATALCRGAELGQPNGIAAGNRDLFCVTWGSGVFSLVDAAGLVAPTKLPAAQLDGVLRTPDGRWLVSSWAGSCVYEVEPSGRAAVVVGELDAPADIGFDAKRGRLLVPLFQRNELVVRTL